MTKTKKDTWAVVEKLRNEHTYLLSRRAREQRFIDIIALERQKKENLLFGLLGFFSGIGFAILLTLLALPKGLI